MASGIAYLGLLVILEFLVILGFLGVLDLLGFLAKLKNFSSAGAAILSPLKGAAIFSPFHLFTLSPFPLSTNTYI